MKLDELHILLQNSMLSLEPIIKPYLCQPPQGSIEDRIAIYAHGFYGRLEEVLMNDYTALMAIMSESKFKTLCRKYIDSYPSYDFSLNSYGQHLSQFLIKSLPYRKKPYLSEIAAFEWAQSQGLVSRDADLLSELHLRELPADDWLNLKFSLHSSSKVFCFAWNSLALIEAARRDKAIPSPKKLKKPQFILVWRRELEVHYCQLTRLEHMLLKAIESQSSFLEMCEQLCHTMPEEDVAPYIVQKLHIWLDMHLFENSGKTSSA